jgi:hypothetical protein
VTIGGNTLTTSTLQADGTELPASDPFLQQGGLPDSITISDLVTARGRQREGELLLDISPAGLRDLLIVHLATPDQKAMTVIALPGGSRVLTLDGYQEEVP